MSDRGVRVLQRDAAGGDADAGARMLQSLSRAGRLERSQLSLLAALGDPAAMQLLGEEAPPQPASGARWVRRLEPWGKEVCVRVAVAAAREALRRHVGFKPPQVMEAIAETEAWVLCPCPLHLRRVSSAALVASRGGAFLGMVAFTMANAAACVNGAMWSAWYAGRTVAYAESLGVPGLREAVRSELVPWILDSRDPLRERG